MTPPQVEHSVEPPAREKSRQGGAWTFENHPRVAYCLLYLALLGCVLVTSELALRVFGGLGHPVLYDSNPLYGYRPIPNQRVSRFGGPAIRFNNLGLRCDEDWGQDIRDKILFVGDSVTYGGEYVSNEELFSHTASRGLGGYESCNAGVNAWGVENIYGLLVEAGFLPAQYYVTVLLEADFYRGVTRLQGQLVWCNAPTFALEELLFYLYYTQQNKRYKNWWAYADQEMLDKVIGKAVGKLQTLDQFLKSRGFVHLIYVSPSRGQVLNDDPKDETVLKHVKARGLNVTYLADRIQTLHWDRATKESAFHDEVHLSREGHALWGEIINGDLQKLVAR